MTKVAVARDWLAELRAAGEDAESFVIRAVEAVQAEPGLEGEVHRHREGLPDRNATAKADRPEPLQVRSRGDQMGREQPGLALCSG